MALVLILALAVSACGGDDDDGGPVSVADATSCEQVADAFVPLMQEVLDAVADLTMADLMSEDTPEPLVDFEGRMEELGAKSEELNCTDEEMTALLADRIDELEAEGPVGEFLLEALRSEGLE